MKRAPKNVASTPVNKPSLLVRKISDTLSSSRFFSSGDIVIIGVSGGPDSTALMHGLSRLRHLLGIRIIVAHFNHRMRPQALSDERFVARTANSLHLEYVCAQAKERPPKTGSLEDWARRQRFDFLTRAALKYKADAVVLAHTADDLAETVLMRILRGSGLLGLRSMGESRVIHGVRFIRPLLSVTKAQLLMYLKENRLGFCKDGTNAKTDFFRNKVRLKLLPLLNKEYNANINNVLVHLSRSAADDYDFLFGQARIIWSQVTAPSASQKDTVVLKVERIKKLHVALQRIILRMAFECLKGDLNQLTFDHVESVEGLLVKSTGAVDLPGGVMVIKDKKHLSFCRRKI